MKAVFFILCLLNVVFFFWQLHLGAFTSSVQSSKDLPTILLLSEKQTARRGVQISGYLDQSAADLQGSIVTDMSRRLLEGRTELRLDNSVISMAPGSVRQVPVTTECHEVGPFWESSDLRRWAGSKQIKDFKVIHIAVNTASDFQIYFPAGKDAEQVRTNMMMLKAKGFKDIWQVTDGDLKGAVSLGVFNDKQRAILFKNQLAGQGVKAEIRQRSKARDGLFIRFSGPEVSDNQLVYTRLAATDCSAQ